MDPAPDHHKPSTYLLLMTHIDLLLLHGYHMHMLYDCQGCTDIMADMARQAEGLLGGLAEELDKLRLHNKEADENQGNPFDRADVKTFPNQDNLGRRIAEWFKESPEHLHAFVFAPTQSGKTGSVLRACYHMHELLKTRLKTPTSSLRCGQMNGGSRRKTAFQSRCGRMFGTLLTLKRRPRKKHSKASATA